jgi:hypothetical protein
MPPRLLKRKHVVAVRLRQRNWRKLLHWSASKNKKRSRSASSCTSRRQRRLLLLLQLSVAERKIPRPRPTTKLLRGVDRRRRSGKDWSAEEGKAPGNEAAALLSPQVGGSAKERCQEDQGRESRGGTTSSGICVATRGRQRRFQQRSPQWHRRWFVAALVFCVALDSGLWTPDSGLRASTRGLRVLHYS